MHEEAIFNLQRSFRNRFLTGPSAIRWRPGRELIAQLLLCLDEPDVAWQLAADWLQDTLDADRVDGGYGGFVTPQGCSIDYVVMAEAQRRDQPLPSVLGCVFKARDPGLISVWDAPTLFPIPRIAQAATMTTELRLHLQSLGTSAKLAMPMRDGSNQIGMVCADWHHESPSWPAQLCLEVGSLIQISLGPLMAAIANLAKAQSDPNTGHPNGPSFAALSQPTSWSSLTTAERRVATLVATGVTYKEVARDLGRSLSTVDHHLRSIRQKLGVSSTSRLVSLLSEHRIDRTLS